MSGNWIKHRARLKAVFAAADAKFGQPEIALGVFAPVASLLLPHRIGRAHEGTGLRGQEHRDVGHGRSGRGGGLVLGMRVGRHERRHV